MKKVGLTLSGGGARGVVHLGVIKALTELGVSPQVLSGSSAGGIVAAFFAAGYSPEEILGFAKELGIGLFNPFHVSLLGDGLLDMNGFEKTFLKHIPHDRFEELNLPVYITATDILKGETVYFSTGELAPALMATACVPVIFETQHYQGLMLHDGGILNNLPTEILKDKCDLLIGVHCNSIDRHISTISHKSELMDRSYHMAIEPDIHARLATCDLRIEPPSMSRFGMFDLRGLDTMYEVGYQYTMGMKDAVLEFLAKAEG